MQQGTDPVDDRTEDEARRARRQALAKIGAAGTIVWAAPVISSIGSAAAAASPCVAFDMGYGTGTGQNGWSQTQTGTFGGGLTGVADYGGAQRFVFEPDATSTGGASLTYSKTITLRKNRTYVFGFNVYVRNPNAITETLRVFVGPTQVFTTTTKTLGVADGSNRTYASTPFVAAATGDVVFRYELRLPSPGVGDDIGVTAPTVLCT